MAPKRESTATESEPKKAKRDQATRPTRSSNQSSLAAQSSVTITDNESALAKRQRVEKVEQVKKVEAKEIAVAERSWHIEQSDDELCMLEPDVLYNEDDGKDFLENMYDHFEALLDDSYQHYRIKVGAQLRRDAHKYKEPYAPTAEFEKAVDEKVKGWEYKRTWEEYEEQYR